MTTISGFHTRTVSGSSHAALTSLPGIQSGPERPAGLDGRNALPRFGRAWLHHAGRWRYLEHDWIAEPGTYIYEPAGEAHTLVITEDSPEPMIAFFVVEGGLIYLDKPANGCFRRV